MAHDTCSSIVLSPRGLSHFRYLPQCWHYLPHSTMRRHNTEASTDWRCERNAGRRGQRRSEYMGGEPSNDRSIGGQRLTTLDEACAPGERTHSTQLTLSSHCCTRATVGCTQVRYAVDNKCAQDSDPLRLQQYIKTELKNEVGVVECARLGRTMDCARLVQEHPIQL